MHFPIRIIITYADPLPNRIKMNPSVAMHFLEDDVMQLFSQIPHFTLAKQGSAKKYMTALVRDGIELEAMLAQFPTVQYEPLDQHYVLLRCLGGLSEDLVSDLCSHYTWRGIVWAALLVALAPNTRYRKYLEAAYERAPYNQWLVELALSEVDRAVWSADTELQGLVHRLRSVLSRSALPTTAFRRALSGQQIKQVEAERERVMSAYHSGGLEAARKEVELTEVLRSLRTRNVEESAAFADHPSALTVCRVADTL
jgi:hypothetical protein